MTQQQFLLRLRMRLGLLIQQVGYVASTAHLQALGDPPGTHGGFLTQVVVAQSAKADEAHVDAFTQGN
ncbi:MAG: hypothetical protein WCK27_21875 [Verrucomicrobiota bacterium]